MKKYAQDNSIRGEKTDKLDSIMIANYGIEKWFKLQSYEGDEEERNVSTLRLNYTNCDLKTIDQGIKILGQIIKNLLAS